MIQKIRLMADPKLKLEHQMMQRFSEGPTINELVILHTGYVVEKEIKKNVDIFKGMLLAKNNDPEKGHLYSSVRGKVTDVTPRFIKIALCEAEEADPVYTPKTKEEILSGLASTYEGSIDYLNDMGINLHDVAKPCDILVINGLNPEPGIMWAEPLLSVHLDTVLQGLEFQQKIAKAKKVILIASQGLRIPQIPNVEVQEVKPVYPQSLSKLVRHKVAKANPSAKVGIVSVHKLWGLGRILETGMPLTETVVTLSTPTLKGNYIIKEGTKVADLLEVAKFKLEEGDKIILGGPLRGEAVSTPERGVPRHVRGVFIVPEKSVPELDGDSPCCNCGACDRVCPVNLSPSTLSRYSEFNMVEHCKDWYAEHCIECGMCGYVCVARRPVLQYIRLAKKKIAQAQLTELVIDKSAALEAEKE